MAGSACVRAVALVSRSPTPWPLPWPLPGASRGGAAPWVPLHRTRRAPPSALLARATPCLARGAPQCGHPASLLLLGLWLAVALAWRCCGALLPARDAAAVLLVALVVSARPSAWSLLVALAGSALWRSCGRGRGSLPPAGGGIGVMSLPTSSRFVASPVVAVACGSRAAWASSAPSGGIAVALLCDIDMVCHLLGAGDVGVGVGAFPACGLPWATLAQCGLWCALGWRWHGCGPDFLGWLVSRVLSGVALPVVGWL